MFFFWIKKSIHELTMCPHTRINILGAEPRMNPFNNDFFNGRCVRVTNPQTGLPNRIPWNVGSLHYQVGETRSHRAWELAPQTSERRMPQPKGSLSVFPDSGGGNRVERNLWGLAQSPEGALDRDEHQGRRWALLQVHTDGEEHVQHLRGCGRIRGLWEEIDDQGNHRIDQNQGTRPAAVMVTQTRAEAEASAFVVTYVP